MSTSRSHTEGDHDISRAAAWAHAIPFAIWMAFILFDKEPTAASYALRSLAGLVVFIGMRPWRWYERLEVRHLGVAVLVGVGVFMIWILPETPWAESIGLAKGYYTWGMMPPWNSDAPTSAPTYAPETCGWWLTGVRLMGSSMVIAPIEEFFWRGFLYRWLIRPDFQQQDPSRFRWSAFLISSALFGVEHHRWVVGIIAGMLFAWTYIRTKNIWSACLAHAITNFLLGIYVLATGSYAFW